MKLAIAIPVHHLSCKVGIDKGRAWSLVEELVLWAVNQSPKTIQELSDGTNLPRVMVVAALSRMMRFRLVEVSVTGGVATFLTSTIGAALVGRPIPHFPKRITRRVSFVVDRATGGLFRSRDVQLASIPALDRKRQQGFDVRLVMIEGGEPSMDPEVNDQRLAEIALRGHDEQLATVEPRTASRRDDEVMVVDVIDKVITGLPARCSTSLRKLVERLAKDQGRGDINIQYAGPTPRETTRARPVPCRVSPDDVVIGGPAHQHAFLELLEQAERRVIVHSTFLLLERFEALRDSLRDACDRGVLVDVLWGADSDEETSTGNAASAAQIMEAVRGDPSLAGRVRVHMRSTGSHAKVLIGDAPNDRWFAVLGSCNWLLSPFKSIELSIVLRDPSAVAEVARALQQLLGRRGGAFDEMGAWLGALVRRLRQQPPLRDANGELTLLAGEAHEEVARLASGAAKRSIVLGSHRLGATARPGALLQLAAAAKRGRQAIMLFTSTTGPIETADAKRLEEEMASLGVTLLRSRTPKVHGKFLLWDDDDVVLTSLNWASASVDLACPETELGVHLRVPGLAADVLRRLRLELRSLESALNATERPPPTRT